MPDNKNPPSRVEQKGGTANDEDLGDKLDGLQVGRA